VAVLIAGDDRAPMRTARRTWRAVAAGVSLVLLTASAGAQSRVQATEDDVKAEYLFKFNDYIQWPPTVLEKSATFAICVVADELFTRTVADVLHDRKVRDKPIVMRRPESANVARQCHVLYISRAELARSDWLVEALEPQPVLLVSDAPDFLERGGTIALVLENSRIRFDISLPAAKRSGLTIDSRLLRSARRVIEGGIHR
jgi:hypothetical protein